MKCINFLALSGILLISTVTPSAFSNDSQGTPLLASALVASGLDRPVFVTAAPDDFDRQFILEQRGAIRILKNGALLTQPFLDIDPLVFNFMAGTTDERGLLGLAFHPNYDSNGFFYIYYSDNAGASVLARYTVSANPDVADSGSASIILVQPQPFGNHNGGSIAFGPNDGYLYIGFGDGGQANDPPNRAQDDSLFFGKILRIDVDGGVPYAIPPSNPFTGPGDPLDEIWAKGLRNPWRLTFDRLTGDMYIADVGQNAWEEVNFQPASSTGGENYGWRCLEGFSCTGNGGCDCEDPTLTPPFFSFSHAEGRSGIIGGFVYRGCAIPGLDGAYFLNDFATAAIWSMRYDGKVISDLQDRTEELGAGHDEIGLVASFGEDAFGEIYICELLAGDVFKIVPAIPVDPDCNGNGIPDDCDIALGASEDVNENGVPDECDVLSIALNPQASQVSRGANLSFGVEVRNGTDVPATIDGWFDVIKPNGSPYTGNPVIPPQSGTLSPGMEVTKTLGLHIPLGAPATGPFTMVGKIGTFPDTVLASDEFQFTIIP